MVNIDDIRHHTESAIIRIPDPFRGESKSTFRPRTVSLLLFRFAFRVPGAFRARYRLSGGEREREIEIIPFWNLTSWELPEAPLNGADRNRNHVNLRSPRVEYRTRRQALQAGPSSSNLIELLWRFTVDSHRNSYDDCVDLNAAVSGPKWNVVYYVADRAEAICRAVLIKRGILDARIDYASYVTGGS